MACQNGHKSTAELLIMKNAEVNLSNKDENNTLLAACQGGLDSIAELLIDRGLAVNACNEQGTSPRNYLPLN